jgi:hypothetical protein
MFASKKKQKRQIAFVNLHFGRMSDHIGGMFKPYDRSRISGSLPNTTGMSILTSIFNNPTAPFLCFTNNNAIEAALSMAGLAGAHNNFDLPTPPVVTTVTVTQTSPAGKISPNNITTDIRAHIMGSLGFTRRLYSSTRHRISWVMGRD